MAQKLKNGDGTSVSVVLSKVVALIKLANSSTYGLKSRQFTAPKIWNSIPNSNRAIRSFNAFRNTVENW